MAPTDKQAQEIYEVTKKLINKLANVFNININELVEYYKPEPEYDLATATDENIYIRFAQSLQNSGHMTNTIKFDENQTTIKKVLTKLRNNKYSLDIDVYNDFLANKIRDKGTKKKGKTNWQKYSKGLWDFHQKYKALDLQSEFKNLLNIKSESDRLDKTIKLANKIDNVHSIGFTLACDFLKECGCTWLAKPDVHILDIVGTIYKEPYIDLDDYKFKKKDYNNCVKNMYELVKKINKKYNDVTVYQLDKMFWLISTHNFYKHFVTSINKNDLCNEIKKII